MKNLMAATLTLSAALTLGTVFSAQAAEPAADDPGLTKTETRFNVLKCSDKVIQNFKMVSKADRQKYMPSSFEGSEVSNRFATISASVWGVTRYANFIATTLEKPLSMDKDQVFQSFCQTADTFSTLILNDIESYNLYAQSAEAEKARNKILEEQDRLLEELSQKPTPKP